MHTVHACQFNTPWHQHCVSHAEITVPIHGAVRVKHDVNGHDFAVLPYIIWSVIVFSGSLSHSWVCCKNVVHVCVLIDGVLHGARFTIHGGYNWHISIPLSAVKIDSGQNTSTQYISDITRRSVTSFKWLCINVRPRDCVQSGMSCGILVIVSVKEHEVCI
jgi:hypothetical protein